MVNMKYEIYFKETPLLVLSGITESGYILTSNNDQAMLFDNERDAEDVIAVIPNTETNLWGSRPHRPNRPK